MIANQGEGAKDALPVEGSKEVPVITNTVVGWWSGRTRTDDLMK
jgi:hypothetical protein